MSENTRSVFYAGGLQFCFPGLGRLYLKDWGVGIFQFITCSIGLGFIWSWIDGYLIITRQLKVQRSKLNLVYYDVKSNRDLTLNLNNSDHKVIYEKSPVSASVLQLFAFGFGRLYLGNLIVGIFQIIAVALVYNVGYISSQGLITTQFYHSYHNLDYYKKFCCNISVPDALQVCILAIIIRFIMVAWMVFDGYCILKGYKVNSDRKPLNYSVAMSIQKINIGSKDKFIAGMLQLCMPGLGRCYMGYWIPGIFQFLTSFMLVGTIWSWIDGHHVLLNPDVDKDGQGEPLTDLYRLN